jgi:DNA-binding beta-propeller fold protein YncE
LVSLSRRSAHRTLFPKGSENDERTLARKTCGHIDSTPDGVVYVAPIREVWVTAPSDNSVRILDSQTLSQKEKLTFEGRPESYAVDAKRGGFYMNYEDKDLTTAIDLKTHKTVAKWQSSCGEHGPHGLSVDQDAGYLFVACSTRAEETHGHLASLAQHIFAFSKPRRSITTPIPARLLKALY